jgi:diadenosine tetraphosphate (Ap4A) HIT family hydrolase
MSPFLSIPEPDWIVSNELAFAVRDGFPVSPGHALVVTKREVGDWFQATLEEHHAQLALVGQVKQILDTSLKPKPDGYNIGDTWA